MKNHIRNEARTREKYKLPAGIALNNRNDTRSLCVGWCGQDASGDWFFHSVDQATTESSPSGTCLDCVAEIIDRLNGTARSK